MKGVVLAGGKGSRLRPFTYSGAKQLVPIANTPVLHFPIHQLVEAGITEIALVVGDTEPQIRAAMGDGAAFGAHFTYVPQSAPLGIAHAVAICEPFIAGQPFVLYLGDNVLQGGIRAFVHDFLASTSDGAVVLKRVPDPCAFGVAEMDGERMVRMHEKPAVPPSDLAVIGVYAFTPAVFEVIAKQTPSARGELEIADAINGLIAGGRTVTASVTESYWIDTGKMEDMLAANRVVLAETTHVIRPTARVRESSCSNDVRLGAESDLQRCEIVGPVVIGARARIRDCQIGPNVAIGDDCVLEGVSIRDSIVMEQSTLTHCAGIDASMIGRFTCVTGAPAGACLTLGDHSRFEVGT
jgi:glucose-1-phosphate thymidylyltransferase